MLFSLVPLVALVVSALDLVLPDEVRRDIVTWLFHRVPGQRLESAVNESVAHPGATAPVVGLVALGGLLWAASGMMGSMRVAFRVVWEVHGPTYVRAKLRDFLGVALAALLILVAFGVSFAVQLVSQAGKGLSDALGLEGAARVAGTVTELTGGLVVAFVALAVLYSVVPPVRVRFAHVWPVAALAAVAVEVLIRGFAIYTARTSLNRIYGPLGALFAFLLLIYLLGIILLVGAELIAARQSSAETP